MHKVKIKQSIVWCRAEKFVVMVWKKIQKNPRNARNQQNFIYSKLIRRLSVLSKTSKLHQAIIIRIFMMVLMILLSKNVEVEIIRPDLRIKISAESVCVKSYKKLLESFRLGEKVRS